MKTKVRFAVLALAVCAVSVIAMEVRAEEQAVDFAAWAPADTSVYIRLIGAADMLRDFDRSDFFQALKATGGVKVNRVWGPDDSILAELQSATLPLSMMLGLSFDEILDVFGTDIAAAMIGEMDGPEADFVIFVKAPSDYDLEEIYERLVTIDPNNIPVHIDYNGVKIHQGPGGGYLVIDGPVAAASKSLQMMEHVIDLKKGARTDSLASTAAFAKAVDDRVMPGYSALAFVNVPAAMPELPPVLKPEERFGKAVAEALEAVTAALYAEPDGITLRVRVHLDPDKLSPELACVRQLPPGPSWVLKHAPAETVFLASTKLDFAGIFEFALSQSQMPPEKVEEMLQGVDAILGGTSLRHKILPAIGPEIGVFACAGAGDSLGDITFLVQLSDPEVGEGFYKTARAVAGFFRMMTALGGPAGQAEPSSPVETLNYDGTQILSVRIPAEAGIPEGLFAPSLAATPDALVVASSIEAAKRAIDLGKGVRQDRLRIEGLDSTDVSGLIYADPVGIGRMVEDVTRTFNPTEYANSRTAIKLIRKVLGLFGPVTLESRAEKDSTEITLKIHVSDSLP